MIDFGFNLFLSPLDSSDNVRQWRNDPKIWRWTRQNDLISQSSHKAWFEKIQTDPTIKMYSIGVDEGFIGVCGLTSINWQNKNAEFSLYIAPPWQGRRFSEKALLTLFYHGFKNMGLKSIWGETFEGNIARHLFKKVGMKEDGVRRKHYFKDGKYIDAHLISILDTEFFEQYGDRSCFG